MVERTRQEPVRKKSHVAVTGSRKRVAESQPCARAFGGSCPQWVVPWSDLSIQAPLMLLSQNLPLHSVRRILAALLVALSAGVVHAQADRGVVREGLSVQSVVLGRPVRYAVYLPPGYDASERRYPVVYLLHGGGGDETDWTEFGEADRTADEAIARREIPPVILVMPDGGASFFVDSADGAVAYERFVVDELIPHVDRTYRVRPGRLFRGVAGLSMGGYGALVLALHHPDLFASSAALSGSVRTDSDVVGMADERWERSFGPTFGPGLHGADRLTAHWRRNSPLDLFGAGDLDGLRSVRWWIDCGDDDLLLYRGNAALHVLLREREIPHEYRVRDGGHSWAYWRSGLGPALAFIGEGFHNP